MRPRAALFDVSANWMFAIIVLVGLWYGFQILFIAVFSLLSQSAPVMANPAVIDEFIDGSTPAAVGWTLASFGIYTALLFAMVRLFHRVNPWALLGPLRRTWREFWRVSLYLLPLYAFLVLPSLLLPEPEVQYSIGAWLALLPAMAPLLFVQISAEELVFRGYLQSHLAALAKHPIVWMGVPSVLFGLIHYDPLSPAYSAWSYVAWASVLGLVCADLTARSGTLGPALAVHFVNNFGAMLILAADDWLYGAALYVWPTYGQAWEPWIPYEVLVLLCVWLSARLALRR